MHTPRSGYGAPEPQFAAQSLVRVNTFVTHHQARGDLVFQERVEAARITEDLLAERHSEAVDLFAALEGHAVRTRPAGIGRRVVGDTWAHACVHAVGAAHPL